MKRKQKFVTPKVTRAVRLYPELDFLLAGSLDNLDVVSSGIGSENYDLGDVESTGSYIEYSD